MIFYQDRYNVSFFIIIMKKRFYRSRYIGVLRASPFILISYLPICRNKARKRFQNYGYYMRQMSAFGSSGSPHVCMYSIRIYIYIYILLTGLRQAEVRDKLDIALVAMVTPQWIWHKVCCSPERLTTRILCISVKLPTNICKEHFWH